MNFYLVSGIFKRFNTQELVIRKYQHHGTRKRRVRPVNIITPLTYAHQLQAILQGFLDRSTGTYLNRYYL